MNNVVRFSQHVIPVEDIVLFEPFVPSEDAPLRTSKEFATRVVLLNRSSLLAEERPEQLAREHGFQLIPTDQAFANPIISFRVESFSPGPGFEPKKPFLSRLVWNDNGGNSQSKLMLASPDELVSVLRTNASSSVMTRGKPYRRARRPAAARQRRSAERPDAS